MGAGGCALEESSSFLESPVEKTDFELLVHQRMIGSEVRLWNRVIISSSSVTTCRIKYKTYAAVLVNISEPLIQKENNILEVCVCVCYKMCVKTHIILESIVLTRRSVYPVLLSHYGVEYWRLKLSCCCLSNFRQSFYLSNLLLWVIAASGRSDSSLSRSSPVGPLLPRGVRGCTASVCVRIGTACRGHCSHRGQIVV